MFPANLTARSTVKEIAVLDKITDWMQVNGDAIYATRPWKISGEGPNTVKSGSFQGDSVSKLGVKDVRFTRNESQHRGLRNRAWLANRAVRRAVCSGGMLPCCRSAIRIAAREIDDR
jgi:alpha-L-fucosidase